MDMKKKSPEKTIYAGHDPPVSATFLAAADSPEISPPFPFSLPSHIFSLTFSHLPIL
jgi:hypothetical protein